MLMLTVPLGPAGVEFLREQLLSGDYVASAFLRLPLEGGSVFTFLPSEHHLVDASLRQGGLKLPEAGISINPPFIRFVLDFLNGSLGRLLVFELGAEAIGDLPPTRPAGLCVWRCEGSLHRQYQGEGWTQQVPLDSYYGAVTGGDQEAVKLLFHWARPFPSEVGMLTSLPAGCDLPGPGSQVKRDVLEALAGRAEHIVVDAFDGESYAIWSRANETGP